MGVVLCVIVVFTAFSSYFYWRSDNAVGPNLITAFVGVVISALVTLVLLNGQTKDEEEKERNLKLYNTKLRVYSNFVSNWYNALHDNQITPEELKDLRTMLFGKVFFYVEKQDVFEAISKKLKDLLEKDENIDANDPSMQKLFSDIEIILQKDLNGLPISENIQVGNPISRLKQRIKISISKLKERIKKFLYKKTEEDPIKVYKRSIFSDLNKVIENTNTKDPSQPLEDAVPEQNNNVNDHVGDKQNDSANTETYEDTNNIAEQSESTSEDSQRLKEQSWHFNAWGNQQFEQFKEPFDESKEIELSLVEYGEYWRTNLLKQVSKGDVIMLFRRGGYGYVGAFEAIGRRIFDFEKGEEEIRYFDDRGHKTVKNDDEQFKKDVEKYDIYKSKEDGATTCANLIVKYKAYVPEGVGNPGGVYRRTISRYDSHYAWLLMKRFKEKGQ